MSIESASDASADGTSSWHEIVLRWSAGVSVVIGLCLLLGVSWFVVAVILGFAIVVLVLALWDRGPEGSPHAPVSDWYEVDFDDHSIHLNVDSDSPWRAEIPWEAIRQICLEMTADPYESNSIHVWVDGREHSFPIPFDACNGWELVESFSERELFPHRLMIEAMGSTGETFCHEIREDIGDPHPEFREITSDDSS